MTRRSLLFVLPLSSIARAIAPQEIRRAVLIFASGVHQFVLEGRAVRGGEPGAVEVVGVLPVNIVPGIYALVGAQAWTDDATFIYGPSEVPKRRIQVEQDDKPRAPRPPLRLS